MQKLHFAFFAINGEGCSWVNVGAVKGATLGILEYLQYFLPSMEKVAVGLMLLPLKVPPRVF